MEYKSVKQSVCINETVFAKKGEVPFDIDFTMPDYCPDIMKILKCKATPRISSKSINGNNVTIDGNITVNVMYCDASGCVYNYEQMSPFSKTFEADCDIVSGFACAKVNNEYVNCRAVSERRIDIHGALCLEVSVIVRKNHEVIAEVEPEEIQINRKVVNALNSLGLAEKGLLIEEELEIGGGAEPIECILQYDAVSIVNEVKVMKNKVAVKGELSICVMYCSKSHSRYHTYKTTLPFSQFLDLENVNEDCRVEATSELSFLEIRPKKGANECREILLNAKLLVSARAFCEAEVPVISDAFSTKHELTLTKNEVALENLVDTVNTEYMFKECFDFLENSLNDIVNYWVDTTVNNCKYANGKITTNATITLSLLVNDSNNDVSYFEKSADFVVECAYDAKSIKDIFCHTQLSLISSSYTILTGSRLEFRCEYKVTVQIKQKCKEPLLVELILENKTKSKPNDCAVVLYYPDEDENLWEIAKRYNSDLSELKRINQIEDLKVCSNKPLFIPVY